MKNFVYFLFVLLGAAILGSFIVLQTEGNFGISAEIIENLSEYFLLACLLFVSGVGLNYLFAANPFKMLIWFVYLILVVANVIILFYPALWEKILLLFV